MEPVENLPQKTPVERWYVMSGDKRRYPMDSPMFDEKAIQEMYEIEKEAFPINSWTKDDFRALLRQKYVFVVGTLLEGRVVGYLFCEVTRNSINVISIAVHSLVRRQGYGTFMIDTLVSKFPFKRVKAMVPERNLAAQLFLQKNGFIAKRVVKRSHGDDEDLYLMVRPPEIPPQSEIPGPPVEVV